MDRTTIAALAVAATVIIALFATFAVEAYSGVVPVPSGQAGAVQAVHEVPANDSAPAQGAAG